MMHGNTLSLLLTRARAVGAKVLLEMYTKYKDEWIVELLFDDLLDWSNWFLRARVLPPAGLISLGGNGMQGARFESGLDNSPMYDGNFYDPSTHQMLVSRLQRHRRRAERLHLF